MPPRETDLPLCHHILHNNYVAYGPARRESFTAAARDYLARVTEQEVDEGLANGGWRERLLAAWVVGVKKWDQYVPRLGVLLCRSEVPFAGQGYCFALARIASEESVRHLCAYLDQYLARPDLVYDQDWALGALLWVDKARGESQAERYLGPDGHWERFLAKSAMGHPVRD